MSIENTVPALANLPDVAIDKTLPVDVKIRDFLQQVDPYHYKVNNMTVTAAFSPKAPPLEDAYRRLKA